MNLNYVILTLYNHSKETLFFQVKNKPNADWKCCAFVLKPGVDAHNTLCCHGHDNLHCHHRVRFHIIGDMAQIFSKSLVKDRFLKSEWPRIINLNSGLYLTQCDNYFKSLCKTTLAFKLGVLGVILWRNVELSV
jgi:hypothetical protein